MKRRLVSFLVAGAAAAASATGLVACSDDMRAAFMDGGPDSGGREPGDFGDGGTIANGIVLVHAAAFPPFRVCFENLPHLRPQPEAKVMPKANVVGVEIGSAARIDPIAAPGKIYILDESLVRATPGSDEPTCADRICDPSTGKGTCVRENAAYHVAGSIDEPLGQGRVHVLAVTGCGNGIFLDSLGIPHDDCEQDWDATAGSLAVHTIALMPTSIATDTQLPVQLLHLSTRLELLRANGDDLDISFGELQEKTGSQRVAVSPTLFAAAPATTLEVDQTEESFYATHGFRIDLRPSDAGLDAEPSLSLTQSLAEVQDLAEPRAVPTTYYRAASNYALLLLGDPRIAPMLGDGGVNPRYDARRGVHLLAVPVAEPSDGGADASTDARGDAPSD